MIIKLNPRWAFLCAFGLLTVALSAAPSQEVLVSTIASGASPSQKWDAAHQLAVTATPEILPSLELLVTNEESSDFARYVLEAMPSPKADALLRGALAKAQGKVLPGIICSIGVRRDVKAVSKLAGHLRDADAGVFAETVAALGKIGTSSAADAMEEYLKTAPESARGKIWAGLIQCAETMREDGHERGAFSLFEWVLAHNPPDKIRGAAVRGEIMAGGKHRLELIGRFLATDTPVVLRVAQRELSDPAVSRVLIAGQPGLPMENRILVVEALGQRGDADSIQALIRLARNGEKPVQLSAIRTCAHDRGLVPVLADLVSNPDHEIAQAARDRLASLPEPEADQAIINLFDSKQADIRAAAEQMAGRRRLHAATPALVALASSDDPDLASGAVTALGQTANEGDAGALADLLKTSTADPESVEALLVAIGGNARHADLFRRHLEQRLATAGLVEKPRLEHVLAQLSDGIKEAYPFFPFCIDWHDAKKRNYVEQAAMLKELGYPGVGHIYLDGVAERIKSLDAQGLRLFQITMAVSLDPSKPAYDKRFKDVLALVKGRHVQFDLLINGRPPSDVSGDERAVAILREMSGLAQDSGAELLLYPHQNMWMERIEDAVRVANKIGRPNVGVMFNLCHWLRVSPNRDYKTPLAKALPWLRAVSICGADNFDSASGWAHYIQPLDRGSFDTGALLKTLQELGYKGPIGLQCYGIGGDAREHLERSMAAWQKLSRNLEESSSPTVN
jgi:sugar phosphate isomerase/epimerase/HEAT repeat protein